MTALHPPDALDRSVARALAGHGEAILAQTGVEPSADPETLSIAILAGVDAPFHDRLWAGLRLLLRAVAERRPRLGAAAACHLIGAGPGATPLGDDYVAGCGLTVARFGGAVGFGRSERDAWLAALLPNELAKMTTPISARLIADAARGFAPSPAQPLLQLDADETRLAMAVERLEGIGATSGHGWAASIGATAMLLSTGHNPTIRGDATR